MKLYRFLLVFDGLTFALLLFFFVSGLGRATNSNYLAVWLPVLLVPAAVLAGGLTLHSRGKTGLAKLVLGLLAVPPLLYLLFMVLFIVLAPDMR